MGRTQFGFKSGTGTREALFCVQTLVQNCMDVRKDVFLCFVDYEKAFDKVKHEKLMEVLQKLDIDGKDIQCIQNLYWNQKAHVRNNDGYTNDIDIRSGVRQGCILSPLLFNLYTEALFNEALEDVEKGIKVNGEFINNIRYADDTTLISDNLPDLQILLNNIQKSSDLYGLNINISKTKIMIISRNKVPYINAQLVINNNPIERVTSFKYLGAWLTEDWTADKEIKCRIEMARASFIKYKKLLCSRQINIQLRLRMVKSYIWSILLYSMESWTLKTTHMNKLESFEMWIYRRLLRVSWTDFVSNAEILRRLNTERHLLHTIKIRKTTYFGHIIRGEKYQLLVLILQGKIEGRRGIGRKQMSWLRNIRSWTGIRSIGELVRLASDREQFANLIYNII